MSSILVVDSNPQYIINQFSNYKGAHFFTSQDVKQSLPMLQSQQFDYILCDHQISVQFKETNFRLLCKKYQPMAEFFYLMSPETKEHSKEIKNELCQADGIIRQPLEFSIVQIMLGTDLIDQNDIDHLFDKIKKK